LLYLVIEQFAAQGVA